MDGSQSFLHILSIIRAFKVCTTCLHVELKEGVASVDEFDKMAVLILVVQVRRLLGERGFREIIYRRITE